MLPLVNIYAAREPRSKRRRAFSLVELLILVSAALVVAGLSVPVLRGMTLATNEESARETLVRLRDFQIRYREKGVSRYPQGGARFGTLTELLRAGLSLEDSTPLDGSSGSNSGTGSPGLYLLRHGYCFQFHFAKRDGGFTSQATDPLIADGTDAFCIYAWPEQYRRGGASTFAMDPSGILRPNARNGILESKNLLSTYSGTRRPPNPFAAARVGGTSAVPPASLPTDSSPSTASASSGPVKPLPRNERGEDGETWELVPLPARQ